MALLFAPLFIVIGIFISSAILHVMLLLLGDAQGDFETTVRVVCYCGAAAVIGIIPFCGALFGGVYKIILLIIGLSAAHGISTSKAALAVLVPIVLFCCCCAAGFGLFFGSIMAMVSRLGHIH
jgi:hypothetical protein